MNGPIQRPDADAVKEREAIRRPLIYLQPSLSSPRTDAALRQAEMDTRRHVHAIVNAASNDPMTRPPEPPRERNPFRKFYR
jgi:hypothetical protein